MNKFLALLFFICLISGCELFDNDETNNNGPIIEMAWLKDDGSISETITSDFLLVHKDGYEKAFLHDNYLVSIFDSASEQNYTISFFDSTEAYVPSRIIYDDLVFVISNFNNNTFTFDMNIIYSGLNNFKSASDDVQGFQLFNQKFDPTTEHALQKLKNYVYGENNIKGSLQLAGYFNTLRIGMNDAFKAKYLNALYIKAVDNLENGDRFLFDALSNNKEYFRLQKLNWRTEILKEISESIIQNVVTDSDWFGKYGDEVSLLLNGGFTIAACTATATLGCAFAVAGFAKDAYDLYQKAHMSLNGVWDRDVIEVTISESSGVFSEINSGIWLNALNLGFVSLGSQKFSNITRTSDLNWTCDQLWAKYDSLGNTTSVFWDNNNFIKMSPDGNSITLTSPLNPGAPSSSVTYVRKGKKKLLQFNNVAPAGERLSGVTE